MQLPFLGLTKISGFIAATLTARNIPTVSAHATTFDAPGVLSQDFNANNRGLQNRVKNYFVEVNLINTYNRHNGGKYQLTCLPCQQNNKQALSFNITNFFDLGLVPTHDLHMNLPHEEFERRMQKLATDHHNLNSFTHLIVELVHTSCL